MAKNGLATPVARMAIASKAIRPVSADATTMPVLALTSVRWRFTGSWRPSIMEKGSAPQSYYPRAGRGARDSDGAGFPPGGDRDRSHRYRDAITRATSPSRRQMPRTMPTQACADPVTTSVAMPRSPTTSAIPSAHVPRSPRSARTLLCLEDPPERVTYASAKPDRQMKAVKTPNPAPMSGPLTVRPIATAIPSLRTKIVATRLHCGHGEFTGSRRPSIMETRSAPQSYHLRAGCGARDSDGAGAGRPSGFPPRLPRPVTY